MEQKTGQLQLLFREVARRSSGTRESMIDQDSRFQEMLYNTLMKQ